MLNIIVKMLVIMGYICTTMLIMIGISTVLGTTSLLNCFLVYVLLETILKILEDWAWVDAE